jgi:hypothetical protein
MTEPDSLPSNPRTVSEDQGFKALCEVFAADAFAFFGSDLIAKHGGAPVTVTLVQQEVFSSDLGDPSTIIDVPLLGTWADGSSDLLLLIEHHAEIRKVRREGMAHYIASMIRRHPGAEVYPVLFVTDRSGQPIPDHFVHVAGGKQVLRADWTVVRITPADLPRLRAMQRNKIAAVLVSLIGTDAPRAAKEAVLAMLDAGFTGAEIILFLPLVAKFAKMTPEDQPRFRQLLQAEVPQMRTFIDDMLDEATAKAAAKGEAKGKLDAIMGLVADHLLPVDVARAQVEKLVAAGTITREQADAALLKLG